jgi:hypothetical protein
MNEETEEMAVLEAIERLSKRSAREIAHLVIDHVSIFILGMTSARAMTISDISASMALPSTACYKIVSELEELGLMTRCGQYRTSNKGKANLYTSVIKSVNLDMKGGRVTLFLQLKNGNTMQFTRVLAEGVGADRKLGREESGRHADLSSMREGQETLADRAENKATNG